MQLGFLDQARNSLINPKISISIGTMILSDVDIKKALASGKIKITPKINEKEQLGSCSVDLRLGNVFRVFNHSKCAYVDLRNKKPDNHLTKRIIVKKGEHGSVTFTKTSHFSSPAYPLENILDPTGAGDTFAGGFMGYLASTGSHSELDVRKAIIYGTVLASFNVEGFSLDRQRVLTKGEIEARFAEMRTITKF